MKLRTIILAFAAMLSFATAFAQSEQQQRIAASYIIVFGRPANQGEINYWLSRGNLSASQLIDNHRQYLMQDAGTHSTTISRAYQDAMGRNASQSEIAYWSKGNDTYSGLMKNHMDWLKGNPAEYEKTISRSYQFVFGRAASADEIKYWKSQGTLSYLVLVACHQDYQRRNSRSNTLMLQNSSAMTSVAVSSAIAQEFRNAAGIVAQGGGNIVAQGGGNIVAQGGGNIVAQGGGNIVAAGAGNIVAQGGGN